MPDPDRLPLSEEELRLQRLRLEAMREEMASRRLVHPERDWGREKRAAGFSFKGIMLLLFVLLILGGLWVLKQSEKALKLGGEPSAQRAQYAARISWQRRSTEPATAR
jgi:hypothetical protein